MGRSRDQEEKQGEPDVAYPTGTTISWLPIAWVWQVLTRLSLTVGDSG